jgi:hypothetical protein
MNRTRNELLFLIGFLVLSTSVEAQVQDLVFVSVEPCVAFDTRPAQGGTGSLEAEELREFHIIGSTADFGAQGGKVGGCGVPGFSGDQPVARAVFINYVAIAAQGSGQIKAWAADKAEPVEGALVNYQALTPPMNNSNAVVTELRQNQQGDDIAVKAKSAGVHVRGVVLGYFTADHITEVIAGTGLTGGGSSGAVTLSIADGGVGHDQLADDSVWGSKIQAGAVQTEHIGLSQVTSAQIQDETIDRFDIGPGEIRAGHIHGWTVRSSPGVLIPGGTGENGSWSTAVQTASCPVGSRAISGGAYWSPSPEDHEELAIVSSCISNSVGACVSLSLNGAHTSFTARGGNDSGVDREFIAWVMCISN